VKVNSGQLLYIKLTSYFEFSQVLDKK